LINSKKKYRVNPSRITVIGGGFIGIEVAENHIEAGHKVSLIEALPQVLNQFDYDMVPMFCYANRTESVRF